MIIKKTDKATAAKNIAWFVPPTIEIGPMKKTKPARFFSDLKTAIKVPTINNMKPIRIITMPVGIRYSLTII